tara:strand:- start:170 stop:502 length:333 start_codon:yes stop_codon:yes gene_type:complete
MEKTNGVVRSETWNKIYNIVTTLPRTEVNGMDAPDAPSVTTSIEELFLQLLPIHGVVVELPSKKSKEFERWTQSKGYEPAFNGLWYEKNNQTYNTDLLHRAFTNEIEFGN